MRKRSLEQRIFLAAALAMLIVAGVSPNALPAADQSFRMPVYANAAPPAPRPRAEVEKLLAGGEAKAGADTSASAMRIVLVAGPKDHGKGEHDYPAWQKVWSRLLAEAP